MNGQELYRAVVEAENNLKSIIEAVESSKGDKDKPSPFSELSVTHISNLQSFLNLIVSHTENVTDLLEEEQLKELKEAAKKFGKKLVDKDDRVTKKKKRSKKQETLTAKLTTANILVAGKKFKLKDIFDKYKNATDIKGRKQKKPAFIKSLETEVRHNRLELNGEQYSLPEVEATTTGEEEGSTEE